MKGKLVVALVTAIITQPGIARAADSICARMKTELAENERRSAD